VSNVDVKSIDEKQKDIIKSENFENLNFKVIKADGKKCARCWNYSKSVGENKLHPDVCERCLKFMLEC
jgi:isoleucyl-tRNA synthetase